jgi:uncharacterized protein (DUF2461 family)
MEQVNGQTAKQVSEMLLELTGEALLSGDFRLFSLCFHLPHVIETADSKRVLKTTEDLRAVFDSVTDDYRRRHVTRLVRICEVAEFNSETKLKATHITHMMSGDQRVNDPFPCYSVLEFIDGRWQCVSSQYAVDNKTTVGRAIAETTALGRG